MPTASLFEINLNIDDRYKTIFNTFLRALTVYLIIMLLSEANATNTEFYANALIGTLFYELIVNYIVSIN